MSLPTKVGHKARHGRHRSKPVPHKPHRKPAAYSRVGRLLKAAVREALAPRISDFELDRPRLGLSEREVADKLRPHTTGLLITAADSAPTKGASAAGTAPPVTRR